MSAASVLLAAGFLVALAVWAWVLAPLWRGGHSAAGPDPRVIGLLAEREAALASLRDLDADAADGRIGPADHARLRAETIAQGASILAALDRLAEGEAGSAAQRTAWIESELARRAATRGRS